MGKFPGKKKAAQNADLPTAQPIVVAKENAYVPQVSNPSDEFWLDPKREEALNMVLGGVSKMGIARKLDVHRNTINNWFTHPTFVSEVKARINEHMASKRIYRMRGVNNIVDRQQRIVEAIGAGVEASLNIDGQGIPRPKDETQLGKMIRMYRELSYEFRENREQERKDFGDDIKKVAINTNTTITGDITVQHSGVNETPFSDFLKGAIDSKVIDVKSIEVKDNTDSGQLLLKAAEHLLVDSDLLDKINEEDKIVEAAEGS